MPSSSVQIHSIEVSLPDLPGEADGLRIAHVSDLHLRSLTGAAAQAQTLLLNLDYHLLVCTGDIGHVHQDVGRTRELCRAFFEPLARRGRCVAVLGNHDTEELGVGDDLPVQFLSNAWIPIRLGRSSIALAGVSQAQGTPGLLDRALDGVGSNQFVVLLAHYPSTVYRVTDPRVGLVLAGHTHGGQIRVPLLGCLWTQDQIPTGLARGLHAVKGRYLYVSAGVGVSSPLPFRFLCPPEVSVLTLRRVEAPRVCGEARRSGVEQKVASEETSVV